MKARLPASRGRRDVFPLPRVAAPGDEGLSAGSSVGSRRDRCYRRMKTAVRQLNGLVDALNWMQGFKVAGGYGVALYPLERNLWSSRIDPMRYEVLARLDAAVRRVEEVAPLAPHAALRLLLRGRSPYDVRPGAVSLAPFRLELLSLPDSVHDCPRIESLLPDEALSYMKGYQERMLAVGEVKVEVRDFCWTLRCGSIRRDTRP
jgi:hypothetical protein